MEKLNMKTLSFPAKRLTQALAMLGTVLVLAACGDKGGGGGGGTIVVPPSGCLTCGGITSPTVLTMFDSGNYDDSVTFKDVQVFGETSMIYNNGVTDMWKTYSGPVAIQGRMDVYTTFTDSSGACVVPAGQYMVQSTTAGQMSTYGYGFTIPAALTVSGPVNVELAIYSPGGGTGLIPAGNGRTRMFSYVSVTRANGVQCAPNAVLFD